MNELKFYKMLSYRRDELQDALVLAKSGRLELQRDNTDNTDNMVYL